MHALYEAVASARAALITNRLSPTAAALVDEYRFVVIEALIDGVEVPTPELIDACVQLAKFGAVARYAPEAEEEVKRRGTQKGRDVQSELATRSVIKRLEAVAKIVADYENRGERVRPKAVAYDLAQMKDEEGNQLHPHASRRTVSTDLKNLATLTAAPKVK